MSGEIPDHVPIFDEGARLDDGRWCTHSQDRVVEEQRIVECCNCKAPLDPFKVPLQYARGERIRADTEAALKKLREQTRALEAEERRVKARTRNAKKKDAEIAVAAALKKAAENHERTIMCLLGAQAELVSALKRLGYEGATTFEG